LSYDQRVFSKDEQLTVSFKVHCKQSFIKHCRCVTVLQTSLPLALCTVKSFVRVSLVHTLHHPLPHTLYPPPPYHRKVIRLYCDNWNSRVLVDWNKTMTGCWLGLKPNLN